MAKKKKLPKGYRSTDINNALADMKYQDLQRACIVRGMDFNEMVEGDANRLSVWLNKNWHNKKSTKKLDEFDEWRHNMMIRLGKGDEPFIRLGFIGEVDPDTGETISFKRPRKIKKDKVRRERNEANLLTGTKKSLTFECFKNGISIEDTVEKVTDKFPEAVEKSIRIWYKKFARAGKS